MKAALMNANLDKETLGAWIVHHGRKIAMDVHAPAEFPVIDEAGKAAEFLMRLGEARDATLCNAEVEAIARVANLNPRSELPHYLKLLEDRRLIDRSADEVHVLGVTTRGVLGHSAGLFNDAGPSELELAAISLGEITSQSPILLKEAGEYIGDTFLISSSDVSDFLRRSTEIGFVDSEGDDPSNTLLFNGNLFKRDSIEKTNKVLSSLSSAEQKKLSEITSRLSTSGCILVDNIEKILGNSLFEKLKAAGVIEVNTVSNETGEHAFVTLPGAFHKYVNPLIDDSFDMAKALVSALSYGMQLRPSSQGRIMSVDWILGALISGRQIGPATAIGNDYRVLEQSRVVKLSPAGGCLFHMRLLKKEVGELALQVLRQGDANAESINVPPGAPMTGYTGPEKTREQLRRKQLRPSKRATQDILSALRGGRSL